MKKILTIIAGFAVLQMGFSQATLSTKSSSAVSTSKHTKLAYPPLQVKGNADYMKGRGPAANQKKAVKPVAQATPRTTPIVGYSQPKVASVPSQQQPAMSNDQRIANLNAHLAQNKAQEQAAKANTVRPVSSASPTATTLKKPVGLKNTPAINAAPAKNTTTNQLLNK